MSLHMGPTVTIIYSTRYEIGMKVDPAFRIAGNIQHQLPMWDIDNIGIDSRNGNRLDCRKT